MPVAYFKCECGKETREIVPMDHSGQVYDEKKKRWFFDPRQKDVVKMHPHTVVCECGKQVEQSSDPKGTSTKFLFNYFEN